MATIVQPYNDWRERAAVNVIGPILTGLINRHFENEANRKINASMSEAIRNAENNYANSTGLLGTQPMPEGYNATPYYARTSKRATDPVALFDTLASYDGLTPLQSLQRQPTVQDIVREVIRNGGTRRFGNVNTDTVMTRLTPFLTATENARREGMRDELASNYSNAKDAAGRRNVLMDGIIRGTLPESIAATGLQVDPFPQSFTHNDGATTHFYNRNPQTGAIDEMLSMPNQLSPQQNAENEFRARSAANQNEQFWATFREGQRQHDENIGLQRDQLEANKEQMNRPKYGQPFAGSDGKMYQMDQYGNSRPFMVGGEHMDAPQNMPQKIEWDKADEAYVENAKGEITSLEKERERYLNDLSQFPSEPKNDNERSKKDGLEKTIARLDKEIAQKRQEITNYIASKSMPRRQVTPNTAPKKAGSLGTLMIGNANAGRTTGKFGEDRRDHAHAGTDFPAPAGTPIRVRPEMGANLKVVHVNTNPSASTYGNNVLLEGSVGGHKVQYRMAHMQTGSIKVKVGDIVKPGDVIGGVGSTGHSTGNHLHLEVIVDGQRVDPEKFLGTYWNTNDMLPPVQPPSVPKPSNNTTVVQPPVSPQSAGTASPALTPSGQRIAKDGTPIAWTHPDEPNGVSTREYEELKRNAREGRFPDAHSDAEVDKYLEKSGYTRVNTANTVSGDVSSNTAPVSPDVMDILSSVEATSPDVINHATSADIQAGVDKLNGDTTANLPPTNYYRRYGIYPAGFLDGKWYTGKQG